MNHSEPPLIPAHQNLPEITVKAVILAIVLTLILAIANAYLALKVGLTISASIPAAVTAMGLLRWFRHRNVLETNIVQTAASAGEGMAAATAFVLPAILILGVWSHFNYWDTVAIALVGGSLGVLLSIPLRQILLNMPVLRYPEGTAIGYILKAGEHTQSRLSVLVGGAFTGGLISLCQDGFKLLASDLKLWWSQYNMLFGFTIGLNPALLAAGYIVGINVAVTLLVGVILGWLIGLPILSYINGIPEGPTIHAQVTAIWQHDLRFIGVGIMLVGGVWTLLTLVKPITVSLMTSLRSMREIGPQAAQIPRTERDIPLPLMGIAALLLIVFGYALVYHLIGFNHLSGHERGLFAFAALLFILLFGMIVSAICGYFAGLVGSTNNPLSGITLGVVLLASILMYTLGPWPTEFNIQTTRPIMGFVMMIATMVATMAAIANDNLQDLKAGKIVGATPWKQQIMLFLGVVLSAAIIAPTLELLFQAYGMAGVLPRPEMDASQMLPAPQASLMAAVVQGVFGHQAPWGMIQIGGLLAVIGIVVDEILKRHGLRFPVLAMGLGVYLPLQNNTPIIIGGLVSYIANQMRRSRQAQHYQPQGLLLASGLVAGASLGGVVLAVPFVIEGSTEALRLVSTSFLPFAQFLGIVMVVALGFWLIRLAQR